jgi:hypothetical protein
MANYITTSSLNLRKQPKIVEGNVLCVMPPDTIVEEVNSTVQDNFKQIRTVLNNNVIKGYASQKYLQPTTSQLPSIEETSLEVSAVHYPAGNRIITRNGTGRVFPLNEQGLIRFDLKIESDVEKRKQKIQDVIEYLDVEHSARYAPDSTSTFCNIYAYDVAYCLGAYLPRVWWTADSIIKLQNEEKVAIEYDKTVTELTANRISDWFDKFGSSFGWSRLFDLNTMQDEVNKGQLGILVAQRINLNNPGHIVAIVPETPMNAAKRVNGQVIVPLQSQAGRINKKYSAANTWWEDKTRFKKFSFWLWKI